MQVTAGSIRLAVSILDSKVVAMPCFRRIDLFDMPACDRRCECFDLLAAVLREE